MPGKKFIIALLLTLLTLPAFGDEKRFILPIENSPSQGPDNAPVTVVEFLDFQ